MTNGEKFMEVFGVGCATYDVMHDITTIHRNGDWWDAEYKWEETNFKDIRDDFMSDVYGILSFLPTNSDANRIIDSFDRVTSELEDELAKAEDFKKKAGVVIEQLRADRDRLATALEEIEREIRVWQRDVHDNEDDADEFDFVFDGIYEILAEHRNGEE